MGGPATLFRAAVFGLLASQALADTSARFSALAPSSSLPAAWRELAPGGQVPPTRWRLTRDAGTTVLSARAHASASALLLPFRVEAGRPGRLAWRWRTERLLEGADIRRRSGDDFPLRLYVFFDYPVERLPLAERMKLALARALHGADVPAAALCYVWDGKAPVDTIVPNAYTGRVRMVVVNSGPANLGRWVDVERDVAADFRAAFGEPAPAITAIAVGADTDDTGTRADSMFGDIVFVGTSPPAGVPAADHDAPGRGRRL